jgi:hypothetical protein
MIGDAAEKFSPTLRIEYANALAARRISVAGAFYFCRQWRSRRAADGEIGGKARKINNLCIPAHTDYCSANRNKTNTVCAFLLSTPMLQPLESVDRVKPAGDTPVSKLSHIHPSFRRLAVVYHHMPNPQHLRQLALGQAGVLAHFPQHAWELAIALGL